MLHMIRKRLVASAALLTLATLTLAACASTATTTTTTPTNTPAGQTASPTVSPTAPSGGQETQTQTGVIGQTLTVDGKWQIAVVNFRLFTPSNRTPTAGSQFVAAEVNVKNISTQDMTLSQTGHFVLSNAAGTQFTGVYVGGISLDLSKTIAAGTQQHAVVAFEAPTTTTQFILTFTGPGTQSTVDYVRWNLSL